MKIRSLQHSVPIQKTKEKHMNLLKICVLICLTCLSFNIFAAPIDKPLPGLFIVKSIQMGDYCHIYGTYIAGKQKEEKTFIVNTPYEKKLCTQGNSETETKLWRDKKLKIFVRLEKVCEHEPPCEENEPGTQRETLYDFTVSH
jgi:hypothetical protein